MIQGEYSPFSTKIFKERKKKTEKERERCINRLSNELDKVKGKGRDKSREENSRYDRNRISTFLLCRPSSIGTRCHSDVHMKIYRELFVSFYVARWEKDKIRKTSLTADWLFFVASSIPIVNPTWVKKYLYTLRHAYVLKFIGTEISSNFSCEGNLNFDKQLIANCRGPENIHTYVLTYAQKSRHSIDIFDQYSICGRDEKETGYQRREIIE